MNVLVVSDTLWPYGGGGELATFLYVKHLRKADVKVKILIKEFKWSAEWKGLSIVKLNVFGSGKYFLPDYRSLKIFRKLVDWANVVYFAGMFNLIPLVKALGKPVIVHIHSYFPVCPIGPLYNFYRRCICTPEKRACLKCIQVYEACKRSLKEAYASALLNSTLGKLFLRYALSADAVIFVSKEQRRLFTQHVEKLDLDVPFNTVIYNPLPEVNSVPVEGCDIGFLGGIDPIKGFQVLLKAWLRIFRMFPSIKLRAAMTSSLPDIVERMGIVRYPRLQGINLEQFYHNISTIVVPSLCPEPSPYVVIESLFRGRLLVASKVGGIPELVGDAPGVRLVPPGDVNALAKALEEFLSNDRKDIIELGLKNREYILRRFSNEVLVKELVKVFEKVTANH